MEYCGKAVHGGSRSRTTLQYLTYYCGLMDSGISYASLEIHGRELYRSREEGGKRGLRIEVRKKTDMIKETNSQQENAFERNTV